MLIHYGKRRWVPDRCPKCGNQSLKQAPRTFAEAWKAAITNWKAVRIRHPVFGIPQWYGRCDKCALAELMFGPSLIERHLGVGSKWDGATIEIPFGAKDRLQESKD